MSAEQPAVVEVVIECSRFAMVRGRGGVDFMVPLPCPYNYGSIPGTVAADGDPIDVVVLGRRLAVGTRLRLPVVGIIDFTDDGCADPKVICAAGPLGAWERRGLAVFFTVYARFKGVLAWSRGSRRPTRYGGWLPELGIGKGCIVRGGASGPHGT